ALPLPISLLFPYTTLFRSKELDAPAIFFVNGHFLETPEKKEELKEIRDMGFMIGNHTVTHAYLPDLSEEEQKEEIVELNDLVERSEEHTSELQSRFDLVCS